MQSACDPDTFRALASHWTSGVAVISTVDAAGRKFGLTMSAVTSLSVDPIQLLICVDACSTTLSPLVESGVFCVNILGREQGDVAMRFAGKAPDKFEGVGHHLLPSGVPVIIGTIAYAECRVSAIHEGGDHRIIVGDVISADVSGGAPLVYQRRRFWELC